MTFDLAVAKVQGIPWNISWNLRHLKWCHPSCMEFHRTAVIFDMATPELSDISYVPWNIHIVSYSSMEYSMEFHGTIVSFEMAPS